MPRLSRSNVVVAVLVVGAIALGALGFAGFGEEVANSLLFAALAMALLALFMLALRLPLRGRGSRLSAWISTALVTVGAFAVVIAANVALYRHDVHFDVSREGRNTPPPQFAAVVDHLRAPLSLTYFYNNGDDNALIARDLIAIAARGHPLFAFRAIDLDKEPGLARDVGVHAYNTAVFQAGDRKVMVENTTDVTRLSYAALRALKERVETICFVTGHGETFRPTPPHFHYSHVETLRGHDVPGAGDVLVADPEGLDRLQIALTEIGYEMRGIVPAAASAIPADCAVVADIGPRTAFAAGEADLLVKYLAGGGRLLLLLDPVFPVGPDLESRLLGAVGAGAGASRRHRPAQSFPHRPRQGRGAVLSAAPDHRAHRAHGLSAGAADTRRATARGSDHEDPRHQQPGQFPPAAAVRRCGALGAESSAPNAEDRGAQPLAVAVEGVWPGGASDKRFRLVLAGNSKFATNEYFPYVSDGELSVAMLRWLAADEAMPTVQPQTFQLPEIVLTSRQMRDVFIALEVLLPLSTLLCGVLVWWRRR